MAYWLDLSCDVTVLTVNYLTCSPGIYNCHFLSLWNYSVFINIVLSFSVMMNKHNFLKYFLQIVGLWKIFNFPIFLGNDMLWRKIYKLPLCRQVTFRHFEVGRITKDDKQSKGHFSRFCNSQWGEIISVFCLFFLKKFFIYALLSKTGDKTLFWSSSLSVDSVQYSDLALFGDSWANVKNCLRLRCSQTWQ